MGAEEFLNIEEEHKREFSELLQYCLASGRIDQNLYQEYDVKRGLRDSAGRLTCEFCELRFHTPISLLTPYNSAVASCCVWIHPGAWERSRGRALQYAPHSAIVPDM